MQLLNFKSFVNSLNESGNSIEDARPVSQKEVLETYKWIEKNIFPTLKLEGTDIDVSPIGSFGKKADDVTSGDIDIAVSVDKLAGSNEIPIEGILDWLDEKLKSLGYSTKVARGFFQVSFGAPINGDWKNGTVQVDLMLSTSLEWSNFIYHSPNFKEAESKYKGLYRNILLMSIISEHAKEVSKKTETGETEQYKQYVIRLEKGIYSVEKTFMGKKGLVKTPSLLRDQDKFITNTPDEVVKMAFGENVKPSDVMTFENIWNLFISPTFIHKDKFSKILERFVSGITSAKMPLPTEIESYIK